ncbi:hypothetical protein EVAR_66316_1 [Eumeta japonica]|uniref:Uncharacterized protein n=1 Tax=Eumeta variegata TaxID=151549 RepID=A0A4C1ZQI1_EUMVA|nr:hypothetical protein EVAR_66316_1 [Eumeta japonica]
MLSEQKSKLVPSTRSEDGTPSYKPWHSWPDSRERELRHVIGVSERSARTGRAGELSRCQLNNLLCSEIDRCAAPASRAAYAQLS